MVVPKVLFDSIRVSLWLKDHPLFAGMITILYLNLVEIRFHNKRFITLTSLGFKPAGVDNSDVSETSTFKVSLDFKEV